LIIDYLINIDSNL